MQNYELDRLGFYQFEWLVQTLAKAEFGLSVEAWGGNGDQGRDAYSASPLCSKRDGQIFPGPVILQAKFVSGANAPGAAPLSHLASAARSELKMIRSRRSTGSWEPPKSYIFFTNADVTAKARSKIVEILEPELGFAPLIQGSSDVSALLNLNPEVTRAFPQILSYQNLLLTLESTISKVVFREVYMRTQATLERAKEVVDVFVPTSAFDRAWETLNKFDFAVLSGPPEMGKTSISWMIALAQLANGWQVVDCKAPKEFFDLFERSEQQIFLADDAFGRTEYDPENGKRWESEMPGIISMLDERHQLVWTSRKHILERALKELDFGSARNFPKPAEVIVQADKLSPQEKALILYRHAVAGNLESEAKQLLKSHVKEIVGDRHFTPLRIHLFVKNSLPAITRLVATGKMPKSAVSREIAKAIREVTAEMAKTFGKLSPESKWLLMTILNNPEATTPAQLEAAYLRISPIQASKPISEMIDELDESFLRVRR